MKAQIPANSNTKCRFCSLVQEQNAGHVIYEDDQILAFLDRHPVNPGHTLVIPKEHIATFLDIPENTWCHLMRIARRIARVLDATVQPQRVGFLVAGFDVDHAHVHVIPLESRNEVCTNRISTGHKIDPDPNATRRIAAELRRQLKRAP